MTPAERTVISSSSPFEVLSLAEHTLGFRPRESLLAVALRPPRWRTGAVARADLDALDDGHTLAQLVRHVVGDGAGRCFVAVVTDQGAVSAARPGRLARAVVPLPRREREAGVPALSALTGVLRLPGAASAERACAALSAAGVEPEPWLVHRGRLYSYACDAGCCPAQGRSLEPLGSTRVAAEMVLAGRVLPTDRETWERRLLSSVTPDVRPVTGEETGSQAGARRVAVAVPGAGGAGGAGGPGGPEDPDGPGGPGGPGDPGDAAVAAALAALAGRGAPRGRRVREAWAELVRAEACSPGAGSRLDADGAATLLDALRRPPLRDQLLAAAVPAALPELASAARAHAQAADPDAALAVLQQLARRAPGPWRAAATGCAAYVAWCSGAAPAAGVWARAALEQDPEHSLSQLVQQAVSIGLPPPGRDRTGGPATPGASTC